MSLVVSLIFLPLKNLPYFYVYYKLRKNIDILSIWFENFNLKFEYFDTNILYVSAKSPWIEFFFLCHY